MEYLTEEDYETAERNGIPRKLAYSRYYGCAWDKEKAITVPRRVNQGKRKRNYPESMYVQAELNGVSMYTVYSRIRRGWSPEKAATTPTQKKTIVNK